MNSIKSLVSLASARTIMTLSKKYPAKAHAIKVKSFLSEKLGELNEKSIFLSGALLESYPYSDSAKPFRQNRYFYYLTGCDIPGSHIWFDLGSDELVLFLPSIDWDDVMWSGLPLSLDDAMKKYDVDKVVYDDEVDNYLVKKDINLTTDINAANKSVSTFLSAGDRRLFYALDESRLTKDDFEIALMRKAAEITDNSHLAVMSALPIESNETHIHAEFVYHSIRQGSKNQSYSPICCSGPSCGTLHYVKNDDDFDGKHSILIDAGAEWENYCSDVTRCFPINGDWTKEHLEIYNAVLKMQSTTMKLIKPGVSWDDIHLAAHWVLVDEFLDLGIFHNGTKDEIFDSGISATFFPHGLGHLLGMDTHDVGGYPNYDDPDPKLKYLRLRRVLQKGFVVTDEPGIYFSPFLIKAGLETPGGKFVNVDVMNKYLYIGGVRIEDDILVTDTGYENFTGITSDPQEISKIVKKGLSKDRGNFHNIV